MKCEKASIAEEEKEKENVWGGEAEALSYVSEGAKLTSSPGLYSWKI